MVVPIVSLCVALSLVAAGAVSSLAQSPPAVAPGHVSALPRPDSDSLRLRRGRIDPAGMAARAARPVAPRRLQIVQFDRPPHDDDIARLVAAGATIVDSVPHHAFLVWSEDDASARSLTAQAIPGLRARIPFGAQDAISPDLDAAAQRADVVELTIQLARAASPVWRDHARIIALAESVLVPAYEAAGGKYVNLQVRMRGERIPELAEFESVVNVEPFVAPLPSGERQAQILAGAVDASGTAPAGPGYLDFLSTEGFSTSSSAYPVVVIVDDGVDNGTTTPLAGDFYEFGSAANPSRLSFAVRPPGSGASDPSGPEGHGTVNASIVGGYSDALGGGFADASGYRFGLGVVPFGRLANVRVFAPSFDTGSGNTPMVADYYARGARISSNSWGADVLGAYNVLAQEYDALTRDAQPDVPGAQPMLFVFAAGNAGPNLQTINAPGSAKNVITVGASETFNPAATIGSGCGDSAADADDVRDMTRFSSRGPTADGRIKPDIVAPGTFVHGLAAQPVFTGGGVCGPSGNDFVAPGDDALFPPGSAYTWSAGTSVATPAISGFAALTHEFLAREHGISSPSPALVKAFVLHSAQYMSGSRAGEDLPGVHQGYGRADMGYAFDRNAARVFVDQSVVLSAPGERFELVGEIVDPTQPVRVVLTWTDAPGPAFAAAHVNDLDLEVEVAGVAYGGNHFVGAFSQPGGTPDNLNNTEAVFLPAGTDGLVRIDVTAISLGGDGVPGNADATDQDFALVAYNLTTVTSRGAVYLDRDVYPCGAELYVTLVDADLAGGGGASVVVTSSRGDVESLLLDEEPGVPGVFSGSISSNPGPPSADGIVQVGDEDSVTVAYADADDGAGQPAVATAAAVVDCIAPAVTDLSIAATSSTAAGISLTTSEPSRVRVRYGLSCAELSLEHDGQGPATLHEHTILGLAPETTYFFIVEAEDAAGNVTIEDSGGGCFSLTTPPRPTYFVESFSGGFDLGSSRISFMPDGSVSFYSACRALATEFPTDPAGGTTLALADDAFVEVALSGGNTVSLFGQVASSIFVGSNGYVTLGSGDSAHAKSLPTHFALPRVAALFDDLNPAAGGNVSYRELDDRVVVTFENVPRFPSSGANSFQVELYFDGRIQLTFLGVSTVDAIVGLSAGGGVPTDFEPFNFTGAASCVESKGSIVLDRKFYPCNGRVGVRVVDGDLAGSGVLAVVVESAIGDSETVLLDEVDGEEGTFVGGVDLALGAVEVFDGVLQVDSAATITATYEDLDDGSGGGMAFVSQTATTLCTDAYVVFKGRRVAGAPRFYGFAPLQLADALRTVGAKVQRLGRLAAPAADADVGTSDPAIHLREYRVRDAAGEPKFTRTRDVRVRNHCGEVFLDLRRAESVLAPAAVGIDGPVDVPLAEGHGVDPFVCYKASAQRRLTDGTKVAGVPKGTQLTLVDSLNGALPRRYDVKKVSRLCRPGGLGGAPLYTAGPQRGQLKDVAPVVARRPAESLVCYVVRLARKAIEQDGCGPLDPQDRGTTIVPAQAAHARVIGLHAADGFGTSRTTTTKEAEVCVPAVVVDPE